MTPEAAQRGFRTALALLLGLSALVLVPVGAYNVHRDSDWAVADWLINYSGGFVRRGFTGSLVLPANGLHIPPAFVILVLQLALYTVILVTVWRLLRPVRWTFPLAALVLSPATLQFPLMDPNFAFRKEILLLALLSGLLLALRARVSRFGVVFLLTAGCAICVLSHEALLVFFPYLFGALLLGLRRPRQALAWAVLPAVVAAGLFLAVSLHPGTAAVSRSVCSSLGGTLTDPPSGLCGGAIAYLARPSGYARSEVHRVAAAEHYGRIMPLLIALTALPILLQLRALWLGGKRRQARIIALCGLTSVIASLGLFLYGTDWTRWIYIHAFCLTLLLIGTAEPYSAGDSAAASPPVLPGPPLRRALATALLLGYVFAWNLSLYQPRLPLGGLLHFLVKTHRG